MDKGNPQNGNDSGDIKLVDAIETPSCEEVNLSNNDLANDIDPIAEIAEAPLENPPIQETNEAIAWIKAKYLHIQSLSSFKKILYLTPLLVPPLWWLNAFLGGPTTLPEMKKYIFGPTPIAVVVTTNKTPIKKELIVKTDYPFMETGKDILKINIDENQKTKRNCEIERFSTEKNTQGFNIKCTGVPLDTIHFNINAKNCGMATESGSLASETTISYKC